MSSSCCARTARVLTRNCSFTTDYDAFFYQQLCRRARRIHLFRDEYIFDLPRVVPVETPQLGHATYLFSKPQSIEAFRAAYVATTKEAIRQNRGNVADRLGFLGRVVHGSNPHGWLRALKARLGGQPIRLRSHPREGEYAKRIQYEV